MCVYTTKFDYQCVNKLSDLQWIDINIYISSFASSLLLCQILCVLPNSPELDSERTVLVNVSGMMFGGGWCFYPSTCRVVLLL